MDPGEGLGDDGAGAQVAGLQRGMLAAAALAVVLVAHHHPRDALGLPPPTARHLSNGPAACRIADEGAAHPVCRQQLPQSDVKRRWRGGGRERERRGMRRGGNAGGGGEGGTLYARATLGTASYSPVSWFLTLLILSFSAFTAPISSSAEERSGWPLQLPLSRPLSFRCRKAG